jgi:phenylacetate-coenzyme A ligase PaaK-like adenylate-forming protein
LFSHQLFTIKTDDEFNALALQIFHFQYQNNEIYNRYVSALPINARDITHYTQIPCLPISFFKSQEVVCQTIHQDTVCFTSSGTTGQITSKHYVNDVSIYEFSFNKGFELFYGKPSDYCILALLPNYLEREGSSLVYMFDHLINQSKQPDSGFYLNNINELVAKIEELKQRNQKTLLLGVTYALLDLADLNTELSDDVIVMETGGMKGKRPEMLKEELHTILKEKFKVNAIHSEYGMTELLSQAYSKKDGLFACPPWMRVLVRDVNDPFSYSFNKKTGGINVIDLANINSCSFIETKDLGKIHDNNQFEIIGRFDNSDIRGCNLMIQ